MFEFLCRSKIKSLEYEIDKYRVLLDASRKVQRALHESKQSLESECHGVRIENEEMRKEIKKNQGLFAENNKIIFKLKNDIEKLQHALDESIARRDELERAAKKLKALLNQPESEAEK